MPKLSKKAYLPKVGERANVTLRVKNGAKQTDIRFTALVHNIRCHRKEFLIQPIGCDAPTLIVTLREATFTPTL